MRCATKSIAPALLVLVWLGSSCGDGRTAGQVCERHGDCASDLQCLNTTCSPRCATNAECGDGSRCDEGLCNAIVSDIGDSCASEGQCANGQTCLIESSDADGDGFLIGRCARELPGAVVGSPCTGDADCRNGSCNIGLCSALCADESDCSGSLACTEIPRATIGGPTLFRGCFREGGVHEFRLPIKQSNARISLPVPGNARSLTITVSAVNRSLLAGVFELETPNQTTWYRAPTNVAEFVANPIRYSPAVGESTLLAPNRPDLDLEPGAYTVQAGTYFADGTPAQEIPDIRVLLKLHDAHVLDINVYLLDLFGHPCAARIGFDGLDASDADAHPGLAQLRSRLESIFGSDIEIGEFVFRDIRNRPDLDALESSDLGSLLELADGRAGLNLFIVRSLEPAGVQVIGGGNPAAPRLAGSRTAGVALSMDTLCYRSWSEAARLVAHSFGRQMGLFRNLEPGSAVQDPIADSEPTPDNLMFFSEFGGDELSPGQTAVLRNYPGLRQ